MNKKLRINYLLNEEGRKNSLLAGGDGKEKQEIETEVEVSEKILNISSVNEEGYIIMKVGFRKNKNDSIFIRNEINETDEFGPVVTEKYGIQYFDKQMTAQELIEWELARRDQMGKVKNKKR